MIETGIKKGECLGISIHHLELEDPPNASVFIRYSNPQYRLKERKIKLSAEWVEACNEFMAQYSPTDKLFNWSQRRLEYILEELGNSAGLRKHLSFDMCRWTSVLHDWKTETETDSIRQKARYLQDPMAGNINEIKGIIYKELISNYWSYEYYTLVNLRCSIFFVAGVNLHFSEIMIPGSQIISFASQKIGYCLPCIFWNPMINENV